MVFEEKRHKNNLCSKLWQLLMAKICHVRNYVSRDFPNIDRMRQINADTQVIFTRVCLMVNRDYYFGNSIKKNRLDPDI